MTEMKRLLDHDATGFEARLLGQAAEEQPDDVDLGRMLAILPGLGVGAGPRTRTGSGAAETGGMSFGTVAGVGLAVGSIVLAGWWIGGFGEQESSATSSSPTSSSVPVPEVQDSLNSVPRHDQSHELNANATIEPTAVTETTAVTVPERAAVVEQLALVEQAAVLEQAAVVERSLHASKNIRAVTPSVSLEKPEKAPMPTPASNPAELSQLREEVFLLEAVRTKIAQGDQVAAFAGLSRYRAKFPQGSLAAEARTLQQRAQKLD